MFIKSVFTFAALLLSSTAYAATTITIQHTGAAHRVSHSAGNRSLSVLYDQTSNDSGGSTSSQALGGTSSTQAADDFTVPAGTHWIIQEVDALGPFFNGVAPSVQVSIYKDKDHKPKKNPLYSAAIVPGGDGSEFVLSLGEKGVKLKPGHYWLSVVANASAGDGEWFWENQTTGTTEGDPAVWQNPGDRWNTGCTSWTVESQCTATPLGDHMFVLRGTAK
jgi:hypothetical protein